MTKKAQPKAAARPGWLARLKRLVLPPDAVGRTLQSEPHTALDRYPQVFRACRAFAKERGWDGASDVRILSFGCSTGEECATLAGLFPNASILGVDVHAANLRLARQRFGSAKVRFATSSGRALARHGPFHMIFCMSVLCHWPGAKTLENLADTFPFARFEEILGLLDAHLRPGGLLVIYNSNYCFRDSSLRPSYRPVPVNNLHESGFVHKFAPDGRKLHGCDYAEVLFEKLAPVPQP